MHNTLLAEAQLTLGYMYCHGQGVPKDDEAAMQWFHKAQKQGFSFSLMGCA
jgi:uncharacterized protein